MNFFSQYGSYQAFTDILNEDEFQNTLKQWLDIHSQIENYSEYYISDGFNLAKRSTGVSTKDFAEWEIKTVKDLIFNAEQALKYLFGNLERVPLSTVKTGNNEDYTPENERIKKLISIYTELIKIWDFLENKIEAEKPEPKNQPELDNVNPYPEIFKNYVSFKLFERLYEDYKESNTQLADFSFIYRQMYAEGLILKYQKPEMFKAWLSEEPFAIVIDKIKTRSECSPQYKLNHYNTAKEIIYSEYKTMQ